MAPRGPATVVGMRPVLRMLGTLDRDLQDFSPVLAKSRDAYYKHAESVFRTEGAAGSGRWAPLSQWRVQQRGGSANPILDWTGDLKKAATTPGPVSGRKIAGWQVMRNLSSEYRLFGWKIGPHPGSTGGSGAQHGREFWPLGTKEEDLLFKPFERWADAWLRS